MKEESFKEKKRKLVKKNIAFLSEKFFQEIETTFPTDYFATLIGFFEITSTTLLHGLQEMRKNNPEIASEIQHAYTETIIFTINNLAEEFDLNAIAMAAKKKTGRK